MHIKSSDTGESHFTVRERASGEVPSAALKGALLQNENGRESVARPSGRRNSATTDKKLDEIKTVFVDAAAMKEKVRQNLNRPVVRVTDLYKDFGIFQQIARSSWIANSSLVMITMNALWIAVDTDVNDAAILSEAHPAFQTAEHLFCAYFFLEWLVKFLALRRKRDLVKDSWFVFDTALVLMMVLETWVMTLIVALSGGNSGGLGNASIMRIARLFRLSRMARMARLLRSIPELMILIKGMAAACRSVFFTLCLLLFLTYVFAIAFCQLTEGTPVGQQYFNSVLESMYTLSLYGTLLDSVGILAGRLKGESLAFLALLMLFILLASLTTLNMLVGVLCEVVSAVAATEREEMLVGYVNRKVKTIVQELDTDGDNSISKTEFIKILENWDAVKALQEVGVDVVGLVDFADVIFEDGAQELSFEKFMDVVLQLRGSNTATVKDIVELRKLVRTNNMQTHYMLARLEGRITSQSEQVTKTGHMTPLSTLPSTCDPVELQREKEHEGLFVESFPMPPLSSVPAPLLKADCEAESVHSEIIEQQMQVKTRPHPQLQVRSQANLEQLPSLHGPWSPCVPGEGVQVCRALLEHISLVGHTNSAKFPSHRYFEWADPMTQPSVSKDVPCKDLHGKSSTEAVLSESEVNAHSSVPEGPLELRELTGQVVTLGKVLSASLREVQRVCEDLASARTRPEMVLSGSVSTSPKVVPVAVSAIPTICPPTIPNHGQCRTALFMPTFDISDDDVCLSTEACYHGTSQAKQSQHCA